MVNLFNCEKMDENVNFLIFLQGEGMNKRNIKNLCGKTGIKELIDLVAESKLVLSVDTGTAHLAAALKIPLIVLFNRVHPSFCKPLGKNVITIYKPVGNLFSPKPNESMKNITVENIITKIKLLNLD